MTATVKYAKGDRVVRWSKAGTIIRVAKTTARVCWDDELEDDTVNLASLQPETAEDIAKREHAERIKAWRAARPRCKYSAVQANWHGQETGQVVLGPRTPAEMREAARELQLLADWFEQRPKETT